MKTTLLTAFAMLTSISVHAQSKKHPKKKVHPAYVLHNNLDSTSYAYGVGLIKDMKNRGIKTLNYAALNRAIADGLADKKMNLTPEQGKAVIATHYVLKYMENAKKANAFMAENKNKPGVITTASGLQYTVITHADGPKPSATDTVSVNYVGTVISGKQFDASDKDKPFVTALSAVIKGWTEGLQLMSVGSKYRFYIPYQLAYGDRGFDAILEPYSTLIFDVDMLKIIKPKP